MEDDNKNTAFEEEKPKKKIKDYFSKEEDQQLIKLVGEYGQNWSAISELMDKNSRQCRDRYINYLDPSLNLGPWSFGEDELLISKVAEHGTKWSYLTQFFSNRSQVNMKNHYFTLMNRIKKSERDVQRKCMRKMRRWSIPNLPINTNVNLDPKSNQNQFFNQNLNQIQNLNEDQNQQSPFEMDLFGDFTDNFFDDFWGDY